jgi:hypothetical protein
VKLFAGALVSGLLTIAAAGAGVVWSAHGPSSCPRDYEVRVAGSPGDAPAVAGTCVLKDGKPAFVPTFPLMEGVEYSVRAGGREVERLGGAAPNRTPSVTARVFPSADVLPANQLKLYVEFSAPMMLGEASRHLRLLDAAGHRITNAFLATDEEMWDADRRRLTVLFEPGRVKRGLKANLQSGAPLRRGERYSLVVDAGWRDAQGATMSIGVVKPFAAGEADRSTPTATKWKMTAPSAGTRTALRLSFGESMDYAVALNAIRVIDDRGVRVVGHAILSAGERIWQFTPDAPWTSEPHTLVVDSRIEDLAGNNLVRPFDLDLSHATRRSADAVRLRFVPSHTAPRP